MFTRKAKYYDLKNKAWKEIEVKIDKKLSFDYSHCNWFSIDGEFTGIYAQRDRDVLWTIASENKEGHLRVEMLYTYENDADLTILKDLLESDKEKIVWYGLLDFAFLMKRTGAKIKQPVFDVKLASKVLRTYTQEHNLDTLLMGLFGTPNEVTKKKDLGIFKEFGIRPEEWSEELHQYNVNDVIYLKDIAEKLKDMARYLDRVDVVNSVNQALPYISYLQTQGYYRDVFHPFYNDADMQSGIIISKK